MKPKGSYTLLFAHDDAGRVRKIRLPRFVVYLVLLAAFIGAGTVLVGVSTYAHMLLKVAKYDQVRADREQLKQQNEALQVTVSRTRQRLTSLQSLASEVAVSLGLLRLRQSPFGGVDTAALPDNPTAEFNDSVARFRYLRHHVTAVKLYASGARLLPGQDLSQLSYTPSLWPVRGRLISGFGDRIDPFNGEGAFHRGVDITSRYGDPVRVAADGFVVWVGPRLGFGRLVTVDHGGGMTTYYAHLSGFKAYMGQPVQRGDVVGYVGNSGRAKGPHLHYEVHLNRAPLNPWRFLRSGNVQRASLNLRGAGD